MRILIADDEYLSRIVLKSMLNDLNIHWELVGEASTGAELLDMMETTNPDIVIVDVRMPKINGLMAIKKGRDILPNAVWIILSGFSEFEYAQEALNLGVSDYLLKPIDIVKLKNALLKAQKSKSKGMLSLNREFQNEISILNYGLNSIDFIPENSVLLKTNFIGMIFYIDSYLEENEKKNIQQKFFEYINWKIEETIIGFTYYAISLTLNGNLLLVGAWDPTKIEEGSSLINELFKEVSGEAIERSDTSFSITPIQTSHCSSYNDLDNELTEIEHIAALRITKGIANVWCVTDLQDDINTKDPTLEEVSKVLLELCQSYKSSDFVTYTKYLNTFKTILNKKEIYDNTNSAIRKFVRSAIDCELEKDRTKWINYLSLHGENILLETHLKSGTSDLVTRVIASVEKSYQTNINLNEIALSLNVTPNYLSYLFHKEKGTTFSKYLINLRMVKASRYLADSSYLVQEVAEKVGYHSSRHFTKCFIEYSGCTPSEFRKRMSFS